MCPDPHQLVLVVALALLPPLLRAEDQDRALAGFARTPAAAPRAAPVNAVDWERALRAPDRFGPPRLRADDAALLAAVREARWADAMQLLKSGRAQANARDAIGGHALVPAARAGQDELVRELIRRGAELDRSNDDGFTALGAAAFAGRRSTVRLLLRAGADATRRGASGQTALHLASISGQLGALQELLRQHVDIEMLNGQRESALDLAATAGQLEAMDLLIQAGADPTLAGRR